MSKKWSPEEFLSYAKTGEIPERHRSEHRRSILPAPILSRIPDPPPVRRGSGGALSRGDVKSEDDLQIICSDYLDTVFPSLLWWHTANERKTSSRAGGKLKKKGVKKGIPDIVVIDWKAIFELKYGDNSLTDEQKVMIRKFEARGWRAYVPRSLEEFLSGVSELSGSSVFEIEKTYHLRKL